jgi:hypothetical protein
MPSAGVVVVRNISSVILNRTEDILLPGRMRVVGLVAEVDNHLKVVQVYFNRSWYENQIIVLSCITA